MLSARKSGAPASLDWSLCIAIPSTGGRRADRLVPGLQGVRFVARRDPDAPLLVLFHDDGEAEPSMLPFGKRLCPGAPLASVRGAHGDRTGYRHLEDAAGTPADLTIEESGVARAAERVDAATAREPSLVARIGVGIGGGADMVTALLALHPRLFSAALLSQPRRLWSHESLGAVRRGDGVEVLIVADRDAILPAALARLMLSCGGHIVEVATQPAAQHGDVGRTWLRRQMGGEADGDA